METSRLEREIALYFAVIIGTFLLVDTGAIFSILAFVEPMIPAYPFALLAASPVFVALGAHLAIIHEIYIDSFEHGEDVDWWMAPVFLGPIGVLLYYVYRQSLI